MEGSEVTFYGKSNINKPFVYTWSFIITLAAIASFVGAIMVFGQWHTILRVDCGCSNTTNNFPILHIRATDNFIISSQSTNPYLDPGLVTFGDDVLSNPSNVLINDGYVPLNKSFNGYDVIGWRVPGKGIYELASSAYCRCAFDTENLTAVIGFCGASNFTGGVLSMFGVGVFAQINMNAVNFLGSIPDTVAAELVAYGGIQFAPVLPHVKVMYQTFSFTQIVSIDNPKEQFIVGGMLTPNNNHAIHVVNRDFSIKKIR
jgi:hypothetical protein